jgi:hypothetical protein
MKSHYFFKQALMAVVVLAAGASLAAPGSSVFALGARYHANHSAFDKLPYDDGDLSYGAFYQYHDGPAYWQLGGSYAFDATKLESTDYVITPELDLIVKDKMWRAGLGILDSYVRDSEAGGDWTDVYWQFIAGIQFPLFGFSFDAQAYYPFKGWGDLGDFEFADIEFGLLINFPF